MSEHGITARIVSGMPHQIRRKRATFLAKALADGHSPADARIRADEAVRKHYQNGIPTLPKNMQSLAYRVAAKHIRGLET